MVWSPPGSRGLAETRGAGDHADISTRGVWRIRAAPLASRTMSIGASHERDMETGSRPDGGEHHLPGACRGPVAGCWLFNRHHGVRSPGWSRFERALWRWQSEHHLQYDSFV